MKTKHSVNVSLVIHAILGLSALMLAGTASAGLLSHNSSSLSGGFWVVISGGFQDWESEPTTVLFGSAPATEAYLAFDYYNEETGEAFYSVVCLVPPQSEAGTFDIAIKFSSGATQNYEEVFTYYAKPIVLNVSPGVHSFLPGSRPVEIATLGGSMQAGVSVYFGDQSASDVVVENGGRLIICDPPPFPGGRIPQKVDVRVVNQDGGEGILEDGFEYNRVSPRILGTAEFARAWTIGEEGVIVLRDLISGNIRVYVDNVVASINDIQFAVESKIYFQAPARAPGLVHVTVINGDGGVSTGRSAYIYTGTPSTDFHPGDLNQDFRFNLSEVLRLCQFFNSDGYHCDVASEDGYAVGSSGDQTCTPYPTDNAPQNWRIDLNELLEIIQFYNLHCYQPCPGAPGTYCPPD